MLKLGSKKDDDDEFEVDYDDDDGDEKRCEWDFVETQVRTEEAGKAFRFTGNNSDWTSQPGRYYPIADIFQN